MRAESLPFLERGVALFNQQKFWEAHEAWEDAWKTETGEPRLFLPTWCGPSRRWASPTLPTS